MTIIRFTLLPLHHNADGIESAFFLFLFVFMSPDFAAHEIAATAEFIPAKVNQYSKNFRKRGQGYIWRNRAFAGADGPTAACF